MQADATDEFQTADTLDLSLQKLLNVAGAGVTDVNAHVMTRLDAPAGLDKQWYIELLNPVHILRIVWIVHFVVKERRTGEHYVKRVVLQGQRADFERLRATFEAVAEFQSLRSYLGAGVTVELHQRGVPGAQGGVGVKTDIFRHDAAGGGAHQPVSPASTGVQHTPTFTNRLSTLGLIVLVDRLRITRHESGRDLVIVSALTLPLLFVGVCCARDDGAKLGVFLPHVPEGKKVFHAIAILDFQPCLEDLVFLYG